MEYETVKAVSRRTGVVSGAGVVGLGREERGPYKEWEMADDEGGCEGSALGTRTAEGVLVRWMSRWKTREVQREGIGGLWEEGRGAPGWERTDDDGGGFSAAQDAVRIGGTAWRCGAQRSEWTRAWRERVMRGTRA